MKEEAKRPFTFNQFEFWAATVIYIMSVCILAYKQLVQIGTGDIYTPNLDQFREHNLHYSYAAYYFVPQFIINTTYYGGFLFLTFLVKRTIRDWQNLKVIILNICLVFVTYVVIATILSVADTWMKSYLFYNHTQDEVYSMAFDENFVLGLWLMLIFCCYTVTKDAIIYLLTPVYTKKNTDPVNRECLVAVILLILWLFLFGRHTNAMFAISFCEVILLGVIIYWCSFKMLIPQVLASNNAFKNYITKIGGLLLTSIVPVTLIGIATFNHFADPIASNIFTIGFNLFFTAPFTWYLYQYRLEKKNELYGLKTALGQSTADLDFLRSQINPHFLFNALNTLYGTALQEKAERTGEGIQKLGDMMRFMLQENHEDKILLTREVEYLENYISLQKLRTQTSPDIIIQTEIDDEPTLLKIAPMMLIPFVENAFKHGISLREPSHIKISLHTTGNRLLFDVTNSMHNKTDNDPEKDRSGIGLENVKQRLQLLYPDNHELIIHQNAKEFFIHLSVTL